MEAGWGAPLAPSAGSRISPTPPSRPGPRWPRCSIATIIKLLEVNETLASSYSHLSYHLRRRGRDRHRHRHRRPHPEARLQISNPARPAACQGPARASPAARDASESWRRGCITATARHACCLCSPGLGLGTPFHTPPGMPSSQALRFPKSTDILREPN